MTAEKARLGKGLGALLSAAQERPSEAPPSDLQRIAVSRVRPNPFQPRKDFAPAELAELEASLKANGLLQPISVRKKGDGYELIAGERRLRAVTNLGWSEIPAVVRDFDDRTMLVLALVENLQRANLNGIEEAQGYKRLLEEFRLTHQQVADAVGKDRTSITNLLRLLTLPDAVQRMVETGEISAGHARALLAVPPTHSPTDLARLAAAEGLSVRALEKRVRELGHDTRTAANKTRSKGEDPGLDRTGNATVRQIEDGLRRQLQTDVKVRVSPDGRGIIELSFYSEDDFQRLLDLIAGPGVLDR